MYAPVVVVVVVVLVTEQIPGVVVSMKALPGAGGGRGTYVLLCRLACGVLSIAWSLGQGDNGYYNTNINSNSGKQTVHTSPLHFFLLYFRVHPAPFVIYPGTTDQPILLPRPSLIGIPSVINNPPLLVSLPPNSTHPCLLPLPLSNSPSSSNSSTTYPYLRNSLFRRLSSIFQSLHKCACLCVWRILFCTGRGWFLEKHPRWWLLMKRQVCHESGVEARDRSTGLSCNPPDPHWVTI